MAQEVDTTNEIVVNVVLKPHDVYTPFQWDRHNLARWVAAALLCWVFVDIYYHGLDTLRTFQDADSIIAILVVLAVFILLGLLLFPYLRMRANFRSSPQLKRPHSYTFDSEGMRFISETSNGICNLAGFDRITETRKIFCFSGVYVPKRCFSGVDDVKRLRQLIRANFKGKMRLRVD